jgi:hypothetical protein
VRGTKLTIAAAVTAAVAALAGCGGAPEVKLPQNSHPAVSPSASVSATPTVSPGAAVSAAYQASWVASDKAEQSGKTSAARRILGPYLTGSYLSTVLSRLPAYWAKHEVARGHMTDHLKRVYVHGSTAVVVDCQDASHHLLVRAGSGKPVPGTRGPAHARLYATLVQSGGTWRVSSITFTGSSCTP